MSEDEEQRRVKEILALTSVSSDKLVSHHCDVFRVPIAEAESDSEDSEEDSEDSEEDSECSQVNMCFYCF